MQDHRRYVRMTTVFPVEFSIAGKDEKDTSRLLQGFTRNVSEGGMCIEFKSFGKDAEQRLQDPAASLDLTINPTFSHAPIQAQARIVWLKKENAQYFIGVSYDAIDAAAQKRLIAYAHRMQWMPRLIAAAAITLLAVLAGLAAHNQTLRSENLTLVKELREGADKRSAVAGELVSLSDNRHSLEEQLDVMRKENERLETAIEGMNAQVTTLSAQSSSLTKDFVGQKLDYEEKLKSSRDRANAALAELERIRAGQEKLRESYRELEAKGQKSSEAVFKQMSSWLLSHQNARTGLVASFEGDPALEDAAFTYDQALAAQAFLVSGKLSHAAGVLSFFDSLAQREKGAFYNAYDTVDGRPQEHTVHSGPNLWIGIAALQYENAVHDGRFTALARSIGDWAVRLQDREGGLPGGPGLTWFGTEHNLDAYAFFGMLHRVTGDAKYQTAQDATLAWLQKYAYSNESGRLNRGKGDATIATDTFGWAVAAIGPATLAKTGFDASDILDFAEKNCEVAVEFTRPDGQTVSVRGFDFAKAKNLARGGVVSTEWTAQMIVSYQVLARYFKLSGDLDKAGRYLEKAGFYQNELQKMIIASPSRTGQGRGCLPYASAENADTGHGWRTPKGASTGSVAGTAYGLFAWKNYNPFELNGGDEHAGL